MGQHFTSNTSLNLLFVDLSISRDRPCHHNPICKGNLCPRLWNNKNGIESTVSSKMTAKLVVRHKREKWKLWMPQFLRTVKQIFYPQISVSRIDVGVLDHASGCIVYCKTRLQKYGSWSGSRNLNIKPLLPIPTIKTVILCTVIKYRGWFHCPLLSKKIFWCFAYRVYPVIRLRLLQQGQEDWIQIYLVVLFPWSLMPTWS